LILTACPLCQFNLDYPQRSGEADSQASGTPVLYFTQLMAVAFDLAEETWGFDDHYVDPRPLLADRLAQGMTNQTQSAQPAIGDDVPAEHIL
jgi:heterodisulfide reductase subunit B